MRPVIQARLCRSGFEGDRRRQVPGRARLPKAGADGAQTPQLRPGDVMVVEEHRVLWMVPAPPQVRAAAGHGAFTQPLPCPLQPGAAHTRGPLSAPLSSARCPPLLQGSRTNRLSSSQQPIAHLMAATRVASAKTSSLLWAKCLQSLQPPHRKPPPGYCSSLLPLRGPDFRRSGFPQALLACW